MEHNIVLYYKVSFVVCPFIFLKMNMFALAFVAVLINGAVSHAIQSTLQEGWCFDRYSGCSTWAKFCDIQVGL